MQRGRNCPRKLEMSAYMAHQVRTHSCMQQYHLSPCCMGQPAFAGENHSQRWELLVSGCAETMSALYVLLCFKFDASKGPGTDHMEWGDHLAILSTTARWQVSSTAASIPGLKGHCRGTELQVADDQMPEDTKQTSETAGICRDCACLNASLTNGISRRSGLNIVGGWYGKYMPRSPPARNSTVYTSRGPLETTPCY